MPRSGWCPVTRGIVLCPHGTRYQVENVPSVLQFINLLFGAYGEQHPVEVPLLPSIAPKLLVLHCARMVGGVVILICVSLCYFKYRLCLWWPEEVKWKILSTCYSFYAPLPRSQEWAQGARWRTIWVAYTTVLYSKKTLPFDLY